MIDAAVILAGGKGTRLRPVTLEIPKPLVPVQGKPILTWQVRWFARAGVKRITIIIPEEWQDAFQSWHTRLDEDDVCREFEVKDRTVLWVEREPMGTLGALVHELHIPDHELFVTNGDELKGLSLEHLAEFHQTQKTAFEHYAATVALIRVPNPSDYGVAEMDGPFIVKFHEKPALPPSTLVSSGLYVIEPSKVRELASGDRFLMFEKDFFPVQAERRALGGCALDGPWYDCGTLERWERAISQWREPSPRA